MERRTISAEALDKLRVVADWFQQPGIKVKTISANMSKCIDPARSSKIAPLLVELGHRDKGHSLWRLSGKSVFYKDPGFDNLFYPFAPVEVDGTKLEPGDFLRFVEDKPLTAELDCLIICVPEIDKES
ncbi:hypothetical protein TSTA_081870 [Talaromyces stipitatus ATCC 10500]|uniref:Uncharacterized protein n=1 Tax=Talaromyces stipitatus (strain ATCC 10500 / CBS 375.48 / QM 6759 / NRRL 1006) TaxID=441959 RepID=B8M022_TALSN|nr:uncharacterized protein TSTA_081870 [Talaromyces stipitatus ATCC 10500]EED20954.1 hypothetical protein TSTA_081870 [Talaromyces stipitatus ATCC 10500]